jgi:ABC-type multidrug transport system fused ATPase/permease subunit
MHIQLPFRVSSLREVLPLVWSQADRFVKARLVFAVALIIAASVLTASGPVALKLVVDKFAGHTNGPDTPAALLIGLYGLSQWLARWVGEIRGLVYARAERRMSRALSERLFAHIMRLPMRYHVERQTGAITQTLQNGLLGYQMVLHTLIFSILPVATELGTIVLVLTRLHQPAFLALFCAALVFYGVAFSYAAMTTTKAARRASTAQVEANAIITDCIMNYEAVKSFAAEPLVQMRVGIALVATEEEWVSFYRRYAYNGLSVATIFAAFLVGTGLYAAYEVQGGRMTVGTFVLLATYMSQVVRPVEMLGYAMQSLSQGLAFLEKMLELFREPPEPQSHPATTPPFPRGRAKERRAATTGLASHAGEVVFEDVSLSYQPDRPILKGVSFHVPPGTTVGIVGTSGSGKTTVGRLLIRLYEPDHGRILIDGVPIASRDLAELRRSIAVVLQDTGLFNSTIAYNIGFGRAGTTEEEIIEAARLAHLHDFIMTLPDGYNTRVGERGAKLSGGQKQRLLIARAALKHPDILLFDEATSSLDSRTEQGIMRNIMEISRQTTTFIIAHRLSTVVHADQIVLLEAGRIAERGSHASLLALGGRYAALWHLQQQGAAAA